MIEFSTERLRLIPLNAKYLDLLINDEQSLAIELSLSSKEVFLDEELRQALKFRLSKVLENEQNYIWYTNWLIVSNEENCIVGGIMLKGLPNEQGEVVIGYNTFPQYQGKGYMTETVRMMKDWLLRQSKVKYVIADTDKNNIASHKVLQKAGATLYSESEELYFWRFV
ncbi:GNAT family N-acetyltransferase [Lysinibacillus xylanilyticus]|uniref:GNAT family N-acetyltransferase n=1 Tax=Lysinibacillus xylanilyticus TaxID=582475 RepID=A0ABT4EJ11_9BACI|nr:GNAT family N-acetyltransferase [Lysinibacillus xylanilyticus]MCY9545617.1 GNAT family N-acetyltransferase [Lysinibacillus xylanilyticus]MED3800755.1 GNAT family N-acetyltransferase [Lysinibacillus xylanilyticus]